MSQEAIAPALRPPLKWAGGKRWLVPYLRSYWRAHCHRPLVEPFCGGLAVALGLLPERAYLNDANPHLINFYRWLQGDLRFTIPMRNEEELYYSHRRRFNELIAGGQAGSGEAAQLFYYLNRTGYNGLCRFNAGGEFNVPFGRYRRINYPAGLAPYGAALRGWVFLCQDFEVLPVGPDAFLYADPPYDVEFRQYAREGFRWEDQVRLANWLARHPGPVIASNQATDRVVALYRDLGFTLSFLSAPRMISCTGDRTPAREILALRGV
ncbi:MAG: Dam family site-specific DNA-(adenine-N6)-methyltransferase [bacterium]|nr:Dam family site-specific DNA-(adenine-N6)-methyltransferase [bacterium]